MAKRPKPITPTSNRGTREVTGLPPKGARSTPTDSKPGRIGSGKSPMAKGLFVPPGKGKR
jgi:hypothetical protein